MDKWGNLPIPEEVIQSIWWITLPASGISQSRYQVMNVDTCPPFRREHFPVLSSSVIIRTGRKAVACAAKP